MQLFFMIFVYIHFIFPKSRLPTPQSSDRGGKHRDLPLRSQNVPKLPEILGNRKSLDFSMVLTPFPAFPRKKKFVPHNEYTYIYFLLLLFLGTLGTLGSNNSYLLKFQWFQTFTFCSQTQFSWEQNCLFWEQNYIKS